MKLSKPLLLLAIALPQTLAWGSLAHRTVAYLATHSFNPTTKVFISTILANDRGWDISDAALWPDKGIRWRRPETKQWHFIDARDDPPNTCGVQFKRDCTHDGTPGCVVSAIKNMVCAPLSSFLLTCVSAVSFHIRPPQPPIYNTHYLKPKLTQLLEQHHPRPTFHLNPA